MSMDPLKITIHLDGTGLYYDPAEPLHLDGVLAALLSRHHVSGEPPARDEAPDDIPIPCARWTIGEAWGWRCSALFPDGDTAEALTYWRKRFRESRAHLTSGSPNLTNGTYRAWNMPLPLLLCRRVVGYAVGHRRSILKALKDDLAFLGKKRAHGHGRVVGVEVERIADDYSLTRDGLAMRFLPAPGGLRLVRPRPPYWSIVGRVPSCEVGEPWAAPDREAAHA